MSRVLLVAAGLTLVACASHTTFKTSRPTGKGNIEYLVAPQLQGSGPAASDGKALMPEIAGRIQYGVSDELDLSATATALPLGKALTAMSAEFAGKHQLWTSPSGRFQLAGMLGTGYRLTHSSGATFEAVHVAAPLIVGINFGEHQLAISPTVGWQRWYSAGSPAVDLPFGGLSVGFDWRVTDGLSLLPEISASSSPTEMVEQGKTTLLHLGVGVIWH